MLRDLKPTDNVGGFDVRPGNFLLNGATTVSGGVNFTIHSVYAVECTLLLFRPYAKIPYARLRFPDSYKIGNTYSMLVFGLDMRLILSMHIPLTVRMNPKKALFLIKRNTFLTHTQRL
jgi:isoamylase